jgi:hypothetical protein
MKMIKKFIKSYKYKKDLNYYSQHATEECYDWDWSQTPYNRIALVNHIIKLHGLENYLEIGCQENNLFHSVTAMRKTGVDPERGGTHRMTSDQFFDQNNKKFDFIFIDGMHTYEQVHVDIENSIKVLNPGGWIAVHDLMPRNWIEAHVPNISRGAWSGDVWKVAFELLETVGISFRIVMIDAGVGVFKVENPDSTNLLDDRKVLHDSTFDYFCKNLQRLPRVSWEEFVLWSAKSG